MEVSPVILDWISKWDDEIETTKNPSEYTAIKTPVYDAPIGTYKMTPCKIIYVPSNIFNHHPMNY